MPQDVGKDRGNNHQPKNCHNVERSVSTVRVFKNHLDDHTNRNKSTHHIHQRLIWYKQREDPSGREVAVQIEVFKVVYVVFVRHC